MSSQGQKAGAPRQLSVPRRAAVETTAAGVPQVVGGRQVDAIRETWLIDDRWWTERPLRRRYWDLVTLDGRNEIVFHDLLGGCWWSQR